MMEYAIQILNIDLFKWQEVYNKAEKEMYLEPNQYSDVAMKDADSKIRHLRMAISNLQNALAVKQNKP